MVNDVVLMEEERLASSSFPSGIGLLSRGRFRSAATVDDGLWTCPTGAPPFVVFSRPLPDLVMIQVEWSCPRILLWTAKPWLALWGGIRRDSTDWLWWFRANSTS